MNFNLNLIYKLAIRLILHEKLVYDIVISIQYTLWIRHLYCNEIRLNITDGTLMYLKDCVNEYTEIIKHVLIGI